MSKSVSSPPTLSEFWHLFMASPQEKKWKFLDTTVYKILECEPILMFFQYNTPDIPLLDEMPKIVKALNQVTHISKMTRIRKKIHITYKCANIRFSYFGLAVKVTKFTKASPFSIGELDQIRATIKNFQDKTQNNAKLEEEEEDEMSIRIPDYTPYGNWVYKKMQLYHDNKANFYYDILYYEKNHKQHIQAFVPIQTERIVELTMYVNEFFQKAHGYVDLKKKKMYQAAADFVLDAYKRRK